MSGRARWKLLTPVVVFGTIACPAAIDAQSPRPSALVERVVLKAQAVAPVQVCPTPVRFRGLVTATTAGLVRYRLRSEDGALTTPFYDLIMNA